MRDLASRCTKLKLEILRTSSNFILFSRRFGAENMYPISTSNILLIWKGQVFFTWQKLFRFLLLIQWKSENLLRRETRNRNFYANDSWYHLVRVGRKINVFWVAGPLGMICYRNASWNTVETLEFHWNFWACSISEYFIAQHLNLFISSVLFISGNLITVCMIKASL